MDNLVISTLKDNGDLNSTKGDIVDEKFTGFNIGTDTDPTLNEENNSTGLSDWNFY
jgi:hypothetical protein